MRGKHTPTERSAMNGEQLSLFDVIDAQTPKTAPRALNYVYDDGGRSAAGFRGDAGDCVARAVSIAIGLAYKEVYDALNALGRTERRLKKRRGKRSSARTGVFKATSRRYLQSLGLVWTPTMKIGSGCTVHLRADQLPAGRLIVAVSRHLTTVIDGVVHDTHDPSRAGTRCVYGYWVVPALEGGGFAEREAMV